MSSAQICVQIIRLVHTFNKNHMERGKKKDKKSRIDTE